MVRYPHRLSNLTWPQVESVVDPVAVVEALAAKAPREARKILKIFSHRIHGAGIYTNIKGVLIDGN